MNFGSVLKYAATATAVLLFGLTAQAATKTFVTLSAFSGHIGSTVSVTGGGFTPGANVNIFVGDSQQQVASATADSKGLIGPISITIPESSTPNTELKVTATEQNSGLTVQNFFYVQPYLASIKVTAPNNKPLGSATVTGSGFAPAEQVNINFLGQQLNALTDAKGNFTLPAQIPVLAPDTYVVKAFGQKSGVNATWSMYIGGFYPNVAPSGFYLSPETALKFSGSGFAPGEPIDVTAGGAYSPFTTITADAKGNFTNAAAFTPSFAQAGQAIGFKFVGRKSQASASTSVQVGTLNAQLNAAPYFINPNYPVSFWGSGFGKNETINIFDSSDPTKVLGSAKSDKFGDFTGVNITVPYGDSGTTRTFHAVGDRSGADTKVQINVGQLYPQLLPSEYFVKSAQEMKVYGYGFAPNELVDLTVNGKLLMVVKADKKTNITSDPLIVPFTPALAITATGESSGASANLKLTTAKFSPFVNADKYYVTPGGPISFTGQDFAPNEAVQVSMVQNQNAKAFATLQTDQNGALMPNTETFPFGTTDKVEFGFSGQTSGAVADLTVSTAKFNPWLAANKYFAAPKDVISVTGHGFAASEKVRIAVGPSTIEAPTNTRGDTPAVQVTVPFGVGADGLTIAFTGESSGSQASTLVGVKTFLPSLSPSTYYFVPGQVLTVSGNGFGPNEPVKILLDGGEVATVQTDAKGHLTSPPLSVTPNADSVTVEFDGELSKTSVSTKVTVAKPVIAQH